MIGVHLTLLITGIKMVKAGERPHCLFLNCIVPKERCELRKRIRDFKEVSGQGTKTGIPNELSSEDDQFFKNVDLLVHTPLRLLTSP